MGSGVAVVPFAHPDLIVAMLVSWIEAPHLIDTLTKLPDTPLVLWSHTTIDVEGQKQTLGAFVAAGVVKQTLEDFEIPFEKVDLMFRTGLENGKYPIDRAALEEKIREYA